jgi:hypothetical protein
MTAFENEPSTFMRSEFVINQQTNYEYTWFILQNDYPIELLKIVTSNLN